MLALFPDVSQICFLFPKTWKLQRVNFYVQKLKLCEGQNQLDNITRIDLLWLHAVIWKFRLLENDYRGFAVEGDLKKKERRKTQCFKRWFSDYQSGSKWDMQVADPLGAKEGQAKLTEQQHWEKSQGKPWEGDPPVQSWHCCICVAEIKDKIATTYRFYFFLIHITEVNTHWKVWWRSEEPKDVRGFF